MSTHKFNDLDEMDQLPESHKLPKPTQEERCEYKVYNYKTYRR